MRFFRQMDADADPSALLRPGNQYSAPWGAPERGPCDKCHGDNQCRYRCLSCVETGAAPDCPACQGRVEFEARCPVCAGAGEVQEIVRGGVSSFPTMPGLYRYLVEREFDFTDAVIVELEGELADEPDLDADDGAVLVHPSEIITRHAIDHERIADLRRRLAPSAECGIHRE